MMFKKDLLAMVLSGRKTQTRRLHKHPLKEGRVYSLKRNWKLTTGEYIRITKVFPQKLSDITQEEIIKEGFSSLDEFREVWIRINGSWDPKMVVTVYEFELAEHPPKQSRLE